MAHSAELYMKGQLDEALQKVDSILTNKPDDLRGFFIKGLSHLEKGNYQEAKAVLTRVLDSGGTMRTIAEWYLSLIDIKELNYQSATDRLRQVKAEANNPNSKKAARLYYRLRYRRNK